MLLAEISPLFVLLLGVVAAVAPLATLPKKRAQKLLLSVAVCAQIGTQGVQYLNVPGRLERERHMAYALYAYSQYTNPSEASGEHGFCLLEEYAKENPLIDPNYFLGYATFRKGNYGLAEGYFSEAIKNGTFEAPSHYLLGTILRFEEAEVAARENRAPDFRPAVDQMTQAIKIDPKYEGPYYGRAIISELIHDHENALKDLSTAVNGAASCLDMNKKEEQDSIWKDLRSKPKFRSLLLCKEHFKICE